MGVGVVIVVRDEVRMLPGCLRHLKFADEVVVIIDERTTDDSATIAREAGARVFAHKFEGFAETKNFGLAKLNTEWTLVVDADERIGPEPTSEITSVLDQNVDGFDIERRDYFLGRHMKRGGWPARQVRLFRSGRVHYEGDLHERLIFDVRQPKIGHLKSPFHHFSHRSVIDNLHKTANYAEIWAAEQKRLDVKPVSAATLYWVYFREIGYRLVWKQGWRDGIPGVVECLYQPFSQLAGRVRLWELQQSPTVNQVYEKLESEIR